MRQPYGSPMSALPSVCVVCVCGFAHLNHSELLAGSLRRTTVLIILHGARECNHDSIVASLRCKCYQGKFSASFQDGQRLFVRCGQSSLTSSRDVCRTPQSNGDRPRSPLPASKASTAGLLPSPPHNAFVPKGVVLGSPRRLHSSLEWDGSSLQ